MRVVTCTLGQAVALAVFALGLLWGGKLAAEPTDEQVAAIKANCRSDYMSYCWSVPRGGPEAAQCLKKNLAKLSPGCAQAVKAATAAAATPSTPADTKPAAEPTPATTPAQPAPSAGPAATAKATAPAPEPEPKTQGATAKADSPTDSGQSAPSAPAPAAKAATPAPVPAASKTATQTPAAGAPSAGASAKAPDETQAAPPAEPATTAAAPPASASPLGFIIPPRKKLMLARNCRHDFKVFCPDVDLGGGRAISCLEDNKAQLTSDCRDALAKLAR